MVTAKSAFALYKGWRMLFEALKVEKPIGTLTGKSCNSVLMFVV